jgi:TrmH family RNA methyltransferase
MTRPTPRITSRRNEIVARYRSAARGAEPGIVLLDGAHLVEDALASGAAVRHVLVSAETAASQSRFVERLAERDIDVAIATDPVMAAASPVRSPSAVVALADHPREGDVFGRADPLVLIACDVQDPGNVGALVRVAEGAGASGVLFAGRCADPFGWKALRGSMGSALRLPVRQYGDALDAIRDARRHRCRIVATVPRGGDRLFEAPLTDAVAILIGGEGQGLPRAIQAEADLRVSIPMAGPVESLNAAVSAAVVLYEAVRQRALQP